MQPFDDETALASLMPGRWSVTATNDPVWLSGERRDPVFEYAVLRDRPLTLSTRSEFTEPDGKRKTILGTEHWHGDGFTWRPKGARGLVVRTHWEVLGARQGLIITRFAKSAVSQGGLAVMIAEGVDGSGLRSVVAADPLSFGLAIPEFAGLTWFDHVPPLD
ncbi:MAG TPA: hypothetical protein VNR36_04470 [Pseudolysinimonas sp.]|nr:hypothetical protein [Pseudolysinimonas sp.]